MQLLDGVPEEIVLRFIGIGAEGVVERIGVGLQIDRRIWRAQPHVRRIGPAILVVHDAAMARRASKIADRDGDGGKQAAGGANILAQRIRQFRSRKIGRPIANLPRCMEAKSAKDFRDQVRTDAINISIYRMQRERGRGYRPGCCRNPKRFRRQP